MIFSILQKKRICLFMAVIMILSGVCQAQKAHPAFGWKNEEQAASLTSSASFSVMGEDWCPDEFIGLRGTRNISHLIQNRLSQKKTDFSKRMLSVSYLAFLPKSTRFISHRRDGLHDAAASSHLALICYIHHQDGAKG